MVGGHRYLAHHLCPAHLPKSPNSSPLASRGDERASRPFPTHQSRGNLGRTVGRLRTAPPWPAPRLGSARRFSRPNAAPAQSRSPKTTERRSRRVTFAQQGRMASERKTRETGASDGEQARIFGCGAFICFSTYHPSVKVGSGVLPSNTFKHNVNKRRPASPANFTGGFLFLSYPTASQNSSHTIFSHPNDPTSSKWLISMSGPKICVKHAPKRVFQACLFLANLSITPSAFSSKILKASMSSASKSRSCHHIRRSNRRTESGFSGPIDVQHHLFSCINNKEHSSSPKQRAL